MATIHVQQMEYYPPFLPQVVRTAINYSDGWIGSEEILLMARSGSINEAVYLMFKALVDRPEDQRDFLCILTSAVVSESASGKLFNAERVKKCLEHFICYFPGLKLSVRVDEHLRRINAWGLRLWNRAFQRIAEEEANVPQPVVIISETCLVGLCHFIGARRLRQEPLYIAVDDWRGDDEMIYWGHGIAVADRTVELIDKWASLPSDAKFLEGARLLRL